MKYFYHPLQRNNAQKKSPSLVSKSKKAANSVSDFVRIFYSLGLLCVGIFINPTACVHAVTIAPTNTPSTQPRLQQHESLQHARYPICSIRVITEKSWLGSLLWVAHHICSLFLMGNRVWMHVWKVIWQLSNNYFSQIPFLFWCI